MPTLRKAWKTDQQTTVNGFRYELKDSPNADGTIPWFRLARMSVNNPKYAKALQDAAMLQAQADGNVSDEENEAAGLALFVDTVLLEWGDFEPEEDGEKMPYSRLNATRVFADRDWLDFRIHLQIKAQERANYLKTKLDAQVKN